MRARRDGRARAKRTSLGRLSPAARRAHHLRAHQKTTTDHHQTAVNVAMDALRSRTADHHEPAHEALLQAWRELPPGPPGDMSRRKK